MPKDGLERFLEELWHFLTEQTEILVPVTFRSSGHNQPEIKGTRCYQVDTRKIGFVTQYERHRCNTCQRNHTRMTPGAVCTGWHCKGTLVTEEPPKDDYNISMLHLPFSMVVAREHSAQVPAKEREKIEESFKKERGRINCLVATPTLEMGVDIGALDMVLMRNVPPKPSNYWQRAGRAGRRHRMAVIYTYCRQNQHDRYFFQEPLEMLSGQIETPKFHLRNEVMIRKRVHATVLSELIRLIRLEPGQTGLDAAAIEEIREVHRELFPVYIRPYLFKEGNEYRDRPFDASPLKRIIRKHEGRLVDAVMQIFTQYWPEEDRQVVSEQAVRRYLDEMPGKLQEVLNRLFKRMMWAKNKRMELLAKESRSVLDGEEQRLRSRVENYLKRLLRDDQSTYTLSVLATEGFLPGYGTYSGSIRAFAPRERADFELSRPPAIAIREFVPGNMIYANNGQFKTRLYHLPVGEEQVDPDRYVVDVEGERIIEASGSAQSGQYGGSETQLLAGIPICDVDLAYISRITDEEINRFQLPVTVMGILKQAHRGIRLYRIGTREVQHRFGQHTRFVNVGPADKVRQQELGYPLCTVCGAVRSPYASKNELENFLTGHVKSCGKPPERVAFSADARVDGLLFQDLDSREEAVNLGEALRIGASLLLEMDEGDLEYVILPQENQTFHLFLYDPMPGGSGLLQEILKQWQEVLHRASDFLKNCDGKCEHSCYRCMRSYRNMFVHAQLDRHLAVKIMDEFLFDPKFEFEHEASVAEETERGKGQPTNRGEAELARMLEKAGFPPFEHQKEIEINLPFRRTIPDLYYEDEEGFIRIAIYLDGLSEHIHGNAERRKVDQMIRSHLEEEGFDVIEITAGDLHDREAMRRHFKRIAMKMRRRDLRERVESDDAWFE